MIQTRVKFTSIWSEGCARSYILIVLHLVCTGVVRLIQKWKTILSSKCIHEGEAWLEESAAVTWTSRSGVVREVQVKLRVGVVYRASVCSRLISPDRFLVVIVLATEHVIVVRYQTVLQSI